MENTSSSEESELETEEKSDDKNETEIGFFLQGGKPVNIKSKAKKAAKKSNKNNREGQWERKRHAKAVYGKHLQGPYLQENLYFLNYVIFITFFCKFQNRR